jgi:hypothetical protein
MHDAAVEQCRAERLEAEFCIKSDGVTLCEKYGAFESACARFVDESLEHHAAKTRRAHVATNGHSTDLGNALARIVKAARRGNGAVAIAREHVQCVGIPRVVGIDFFFFGDRLLVYEDRDAQSDRFVHKRAVLWRKDFQGHAAARSALGEGQPRAVQSRAL